MTDKTKYICNSDSDSDNDSENRHKYFYFSELLSVKSVLQQRIKKSH